MIDGAMADMELYGKCEDGANPRCDSCGKRLDVQSRENGPDVGWCDGCGLTWYLRARSDHSDGGENDG